jgi:hypothetical protein
MPTNFDADAARREPGNDGGSVSAEVRTTAENVRIFYSFRRGSNFPAPFQCVNNWHEICLNRADSIHRRVTAITAGRDAKESDAAMKQMALAVAMSCPLTIAAVSAHAAPIFTTSIPVPGGAADDRNVGFTLNPASLSIGSGDKTGSKPDQSAPIGAIGESVQPDGQAISGPSGSVVAGSGQAQAGFARGAVYSGAPNSGTIYVAPKDGTPQPFVTLPGETVRQIVFDSGHANGGDMLVSTGSGAIYRVTSTGVASLLAAQDGGAGDLDVASSAPALFAGGMSISPEGGEIIGAVGQTGNIAGAGSGELTAETAVAAPLNFISSGLNTGGSFGANHSDVIPPSGYSQFISYEGAPTVTSGPGGSPSSGWLPPATGSSDSVAIRMATVDLPPIAMRGARPEDVVIGNSQRISDWLPAPSTVLLVGTVLVVLGGLGQLSRRRD